MDISVIILTANERLHIGRCLERLMPLEPQQVFVIDCFSTDGTQEIAKSFNHDGHNEKSGEIYVTPANTPAAEILTTQSSQSESGMFSGGSEAKPNGGAGKMPHSPVGDSIDRLLVQVIEHKWPGNQAKQFNWALDNCKIKSKWVLRIDADEYLSNELIEEIKEKVANLPQNVTAVGFPRLATWQGKLLKHGTGAVMITRLFRFGKARSNDRKMDEQIVPFEGEVVVFEHLFFDDNLNGFDWWQAKHRGYAEREAQSMIEEKYGDAQANPKKAAYLKVPPYVRCVLYWAYRYFVRLGFLDGIVGWRWNFWQGLWYRWIVDRRYCELRKERIARQR